jgi:hypothetical protein
VYNSSKSTRCVPLTAVQVAACEVVLFNIIKAAMQAVNFMREPRWFFA